ncbi:MAG: glycosyltransferase family 8 protein [Alphaproteobacteria bacterium]|nr:glycosyltransferase family 8 protein [Alphaproteobacteria bacterium]
MKSQNRIPVFYEGQDDLIGILATSIASVCYNTKSFIDFYILDCGICDFNKKQLESLKNKFSNFSIEFIPIDLKQFKGLTGWGPGNFIDCYARLLIPELKPNLKKVIYLDSDIIALDDIDLLWQQNLENYTYAAVPDLGYDDYFFKHCKNDLGVADEHIYPNAGVLLLDTEQCRKMNFTEQVLKLAKQKKRSIIVIIEDLLSIYFGTNNYKRLDNRYNLTDRSNEIQKICAPEITDEYLQEEWKHIVLQHLSPGKAWKLLKNSYNGRDLKLFDNFWFFAQMTPFYDGLTKKYYTEISSIYTQMVLSSVNNINSKVSHFNIEKQSNLTNPIRKSKSYKLFDFIPLLKIKEK